MFFLIIIIRSYFSVHITTSVYPVPSICRFDQLGDWFESLADILHWNLRKSQIHFGINSFIQHDNELHIEDRNDSSSMDTLKSST